MRHQTGTHETWRPEQDIPVLDRAGAMTGSTGPCESLRLQGVSAGSLGARKPGRSHPWCVLEWISN